MTENNLQKSLIDLTRARPTVINWPANLLQIVDDYRSCRGVPHGVQKDAIQNAWDARVAKHAKGWSVTFELLKPKKGKNFLVITDKGTTGLTGKILEKSELQEDLPAEEKWGRFENVAFTKAPSEKALGSRGRGKFIFLGASKHHEVKTPEGETVQNLILYDTLRADGIYRFGYRTIVTTDSPIDAFDNDEGRGKLEQLTEGLIEPLNKIGTRVIIVDPDNELINDIESGKFIGYIGETWWEIIDKYNAKIEVKVGDKVWKAKVPDEFVLPEKDSRNFKVWIQRNVALPVKGNFRIKTLHIVRRINGSVPEELQGVAIQRSGMKICSILIKYVPQEITDSVYGYITLDTKLDEAIKTDENPEHYWFDFKKSLPRAVKQYIEDELAKFAREKLELGIDPRKIQHERQTNAEQRAVFAINKIASKLGLIGKGVGPPTPPLSPPPPQPTKELFIDIPPFEFPRVIRRVNYGEAVKNIRLIATNNSKKSAKVGLKMYLLFGGDELLYYIKNEVVEINAGDSKEFGPFEQYFTENGFPGRGRYIIRAKMVSLEKKTKGDIIDEISRHFFLEQDPPEKGIFEKCEALDFPEEMEKITGEAVAGEAGGYIFQYNNNHPAKKAVDTEEDNLADYLVMIMAHELPWIDLRRETPTQFTEKELESPEAIAKKISIIIGEILHIYYSS